MKKRIIWTNDLDPKDWEDDYESWLEDGGYTEEDNPMSLDEWMYESNSIYLGDERMNLDVKVNGVIVAYGVLGLWDGKHVGGKVVGVNVSRILHTECDGAEWYCDQYNVRFNGVHHDGCNTILYRVAKDMKTANRLVDKIISGELTEDKFRKRTKSLRPYVAKVYGW